MFFVHVIVLEGKEIDRFFVENNYLFYFRLFEKINFITYTRKN